MERFALGSGYNSTFRPDEMRQALVLSDLQTNAVDTLHRHGIIERAIVNLPGHEQSLVMEHLLGIFVGRLTIHGQPVTERPPACLVYRYHDPAEESYIPSVIQHVGEYACGRVQPCHGFTQDEAEAVEHAVAGIELARSAHDLPNLGADCMSIRYIDSTIPHIER